LDCDDLTATLLLVLRSRAERGVSKDAPSRAIDAAPGTILRDATLRVTPQDEERAVHLLPAVRRKAVAR
jgi:hypothetical protein